MLQIKDSEGKTSLNLQNKAASAVFSPLETTGHSAKALVEMHPFSLFASFCLSPDIPTADMVSAMRTPFRAAIPYPWLVFIHYEMK